jgi:hypothetical protein
MGGITIKIDLTGPKELAKAFGWFLALGASETQHIRDELQDLLLHTTQTLKALVQLTEALYQIEADDFDEKSYLPVFFHCSQNFTSPEAAQKARSHCTDIQRDIERIQFKLAKVLRAKVGRWKSLDEAFKRLADADRDFLDQFEADMQRVDEELLEIVRLVREDRQEAWKRYEGLRSTLLDSISRLREEVAAMRQAEDHIRGILT